MTLVLALAVPLNLLVMAAIWQLTQSAAESQRTGLLYTARAVASAVDVHIGKYIGLAQSLANSPALLVNDLTSFAAEARRAFPPEGGAWLVLADLDGQQLFNSAVEVGHSLPRRHPGAYAVQQLAIANRTVTVADNIVIGPLTKNWVATIEVPVFKDGKPFLALAVAMRMQGFQSLLSGHRLPQGWLAGLIDAQGLFLARVPYPDQHVGQLASEGWRQIKHQDGVFEFSSIEGTPIVQGNTHPSLVPAWTVGIAVPLSELQGAAWRTVRWSALLGLLVSGLSFALAFIIARSIEEPIAELRQKALSVLEGSAPGFGNASPEFQELANALSKGAAERRRGEEASQRLAAIVRTSFDAIISKTLEGTITSWNASAETMFGYTPEEMIGTSIRRLIPPDRQHEEDDILHRLAANQRVEPFETVRIRKDGRIIHVSVTISPLTDARGNVVGASKVARDISEQKTREEHVQLLVRELSHRSKNLLAVIQSVAHRTAANNPTEFLDSFTRRLHAMAVNQDILAKNEWQGIDLEELLKAQLEPFGLEDRVRLSGAQTLLTVGAAQALGMALHELATNAGKYGALSTQDGTVEIVWARNGNTFTMSWRESCGPVVLLPTAHGFGSVIISRMVEQALDGTVSVDYPPTGLIWRLTCPLDRTVQENS